jgi:hypothetical protein
LFLIFGTKLSIFGTGFIIYLKFARISFQQYFFQQHQAPEVQYYKDFKKERCRSYRAFTFCFLLAYQNAAPTELAFCKISTRGAVLWYPKKLVLR